MACINSLCWSGTIKSTPRESPDISISTITKACSLHWHRWNSSVENSPSLISGTCKVNPNSSSGSDSRRRYTIYTVDSIVMDVTFFLSTNPPSSSRSPVSVPDIQSLFFQRKGHKPWSIAYAHPIRNSVHTRYAPASFSALFQNTAGATTYVSNYSILRTSLKGAIFRGAPDTGVRLSFGLVHTTDTMTSWLQLQEDYSTEGCFQVVFTLPMVVVFLVTKAYPLSYSGFII